MPYRKINIWQSLDWWSVALYLILVIFGWFSIYGASYNFDHVGILNFSGRSGSQAIWIFISIAVAFVIIMIDNDWYSFFSYWAYFGLVFLLIVTIFIAPDIKGSRSWLVIGSSQNPFFSIQPAEFAKFATALALAKWMNTYQSRFLEFKNFAYTLALILFPTFLIVMQKEAGSALVFLSFFIVLYREGMSGTVLFLAFCAVLFFIIGIKFADVQVGVTPMGQFIVLLLIIIFVIGLFYSKGKKISLPLRYTIAGFLGVFLLSFLVSLIYPFNWIYVALACIGVIVGYLLYLFQKYWFKRYALMALFAILSVVYLYSVDYVFNNILEPHQQIRIQVVLGITDDPSGAGYNVNQSKIAIGSGGFTGKGFLNGTQTKLKYVPEQDTDFIFCTVGEEQGFWGASLVLILFLALIMRLSYLAERQRSTFNRVYGYSVLSILFFHVAINIGMVLGITPVIGIPLPFFSYGGSSLLAFTILLFIFLRLDAARKDRL